MPSQDPSEPSIARQLANFRDVGGLRARSGLIRPGVLYRSDAPFAGDEAPQAAAVWPPDVVIDLRSPGEANNRYPWPESTTLHQLPLLAEAAPALQTGALDQLYLHILEAAPERLARIATIVARAQGPVLVHCSAGKDRTGVAIALLLLTVGVEPEVIEGDYQLTAPNVAGSLDRVKALGYDLPIQSELPPHLLETPPNALAPVLAQISQAPGGAVGWLIAHGASAADVALLSQRLIAGPRA
jgi:protein-tyrosine phosphatase